MTKKSKKNRLIVSRNSKHTIFGKGFIWCIVFTIFTFLIICVLPWLFTNFSFLDFTETGQIGDTIGGVMGPFVAIVASLLTFLAFWVQFKANEQQRSDLAIERFENSLFQMMSLQEEITHNLRYTADFSSDILASGRHVFEYIYLHRQKDWHTGLKMSIHHEGLSAMVNDHSLWCLDHYFLHLYRILKWVDKGGPEFLTHKERYNYAAIVRSMLSEFELIMIYYNALSINDNDKFKKLIEEYSILDNLRLDLLARTEEREYYEPLRNNAETPDPTNLCNKYYQRKAILHTSNDECC